MKILDQFVLKLCTLKIRSQSDVMEYSVVDSGNKL